MVTKNTKNSNVFVSFFTAGVKKYAFLLLLIAIFFLLSACGGATVEAPEPVEINLYASLGAKALAQNLSDSYGRNHPHLTFNLAGGNATQALNQLAAGEADIVFLSNLPAGAEQFQQIPIAREGLAIIVHPNNPLANITLSDLAHLYTGKYFNWRDIQGRAGPVQVVVRERGSGNRAIFEDLAMAGQRITPNARVLPNGEAVVDFVAENEEAIGYVDTAYITDAVKVLTVEEMAPNPDNLQDGAYPLTHLVYALTLLESDELVNEFINFIQRPAGQKIVAESGLGRVK